MGHSWRAVAPLVVARKNWGGNRTEKGARAQAVLSSILASARQQGKNPLDVLIELLVNKDKSKILVLVPPRCGPLPDRSSAALPERVLPARSRSPSRAEGPVPRESVALYALASGVGSTPAGVQL